MKSLFFLILICLSIPVLAQEKTTVPIVAYWSKGDTLNFKIFKKIEKINDGKESQDSTTYYSQFIILDSTETSYQILWKNDFKQQISSLPFNLSDPIQSLQDINYIYSTNELGQFQSLDNWQEIATNLKNYLSLILQKLPTSDSVENSAFKNSMNQFLEIYTSKEGLESLVMREIRLLHSTFGAEYLLGDTIRYEEQVNNAIDNSPMNINNEIFLSEIDEENYNCIIVQNSFVSEEEMKSMITSFAEKLKLPFDEAFKDFQIDNNEKRVFSIDYNYGIPNYIYNKKTNKVKVKEQTGYRIDTIEIELL